MAEEGTKIVGEEEGASLSPQVQEEKSEEKARTKGWKPLDEFKGDPADWVPAKEFLGRERLFDKIHDLRNQLSRQAQRFEQDMGRIQAHFLKVQEAEYAKAKRDLEGQLARAKANEDVDAVAEIAGQIKEVETEQKAAKKEQKVVSQGGPTPEFVEWQEQNSWFNKDAEMTADAIAIGTGYAAANQTKSQKDVLEHVAAKIKKLYPEKFDEPRKGKVEDNRVESGGTRTRPAKKGALSVEDLNDTERTVMRSLIKRNALKDVAAKNKRSQEEEYLAQLAERKAAGG